MKKMRNNLKIFAVGAFIAVNFTACGILPYEETFICNKGLNSGGCQSVSENYRDTFIDKNDIPLTIKQKEVLIDQLEDQGIINDAWFGDDEVLDWVQIEQFNRPRLQHILATYDFDEETTARIKKLIDKTGPDLDYQKVKVNKMIENEELFKYLRLRNESLNEENLKLKHSK